MTADFRTCDNLFRAEATSLQDTIVISLSRPQPAPTPSVRATSALAWPAAGFRPPKQAASCALISSHGAAAFCRAQYNANELGYVPWRGRKEQVETATVGNVIVSAKIENLFDIEKVFEGQKSDAQVRRVEVDDATVDTGATSLSLPKRLIEQLGLRQLRTGRADHERCGDIWSVQPGPTYGSRA